MDDNEIVKLADRNKNQLKAYIYSLCYDWSYVDDILQETMVSLVKSADTYDESRSFLAWAFTIARRRSIDFMRKQGKERLLFTDEVYDQLEAEHLAIEEENSQSRNIKYLRECLKSLSRENQTIMHLKYFKKQKVELIAKKLNRSFLSVQSLLDRLRKKLKQCVNKKMNA